MSASTVLVLFMVGNRVVDRAGQQTESEYRFDCHAVFLYQWRILYGFESK